MQEYQKKLSELEVSFTSDDKTCKVTANPQDGVVDIKFLSLDYQSMPPEKLAEVLVEAIQAANRRVREEMMEDLPSFPIEGFSNREVLDGEVSVEDVFPIDKILSDASEMLNRTAGRKSSG
jgi:DNA-binding protein YbaB